MLRRRARTAAETTLSGAEPRSCARTQRVTLERQISRLALHRSPKENSKWFRTQVNRSTGALGVGGPCNTDRRTTFRRAPVLRSCPPPSAVTSARQSFLRDGKTYVTLLYTGKLCAPPTGKLRSSFFFPGSRSSSVSSETLCGLFPTKNYVTTQNIRDPTRLRSITFFPIFSVLISDC